MAIRSFRLFHEAWLRAAEADLSPTLWHVDNYATACNIHCRDGCNRKWQKNGRFGAFKANFKNIARPMVVHPDDRADHRPAGVAHLKPDQVVVVELVIRQFGKPGPIHEKLGPFQGIGLFLGRHPGKARTKATGHRPGQLDLEAAGAVPGESGPYEAMSAASVQKDFSRTSP